MHHNRVLGPGKNETQDEIENGRCGICLVWMRKKYTRSERWNKKLKMGICLLYLWIGGEKRKKYTRSGRWNSKEKNEDEAMFSWNGKKY